MLKSLLEKRETPDFLDKNPLSKKLLFSELAEEKFIFPHIQRIIEKNGITLDVYSKVSYKVGKKIVYNYSIIDNIRDVAIEESKDYNSRDEAECEGFFKSLLVLERYLK